MLALGPVAEERLEVRVVQGQQVAAWQATSRKHAAPPTWDAAAGLDPTRAALSRVGAGQLHCAARLVEATTITRQGQQVDKQNLTEGRRMGCMGAGDPSAPFGAAPYADCLSTIRSGLPANPNRSRRRFSR